MSGYLWSTTTPARSSAVCRWEWSPISPETGASSLKDDSIRVSLLGSGRVGTRRTKRAAFRPRRIGTELRGKPAVTHFRVLRRFAAHTFLALRLESGRTHQIRVHMAHARHPLAGDQAYGGRLKMPAGMSDAQRDALRGFHRQALHASRLIFRHPADDREMIFQSRLPDDFVRVLQVLDDPSRPAAYYNELQWPETHPASN